MIASRGRRKPLSASDKSPLYLSMVELTTEEGHKTIWGHDPAKNEVWAPFSMLPNALVCAVALSSGQVIWDTNLEPFVRASFLLESMGEVDSSEWARCGLTHEQAVAKIGKMIDTVRASALSPRSSRSDG